MSKFNKLVSDATKEMQRTMPGGRHSIPIMSQPEAEKFFKRKASPDTKLSPKEFLKKNPIINTKAIKNKVIDITSDIISAPARYKANKAMKQADKDVAALKNARKYKDVPNFDYLGKPNKEAIMAKDAAEQVRIRLTKKK